MVWCSPQVRRVRAPMLSRSASARREKRNAATRLALRRGEVECFPDTRKWVAFGDAAGVALVNGRAQRGKLRLVLSFLTIQVAQRGAYDLAGVFVAATLYLLQHEAVKLVGQIDITGRHGSSFLVWCDSRPMLPWLAKIAKRVAGTGITAITRPVFLCDPCAFARKRVFFALPVNTPHLAKLKTRYGYQQRLARNPRVSPV